VRATSFGPRPAGHGSLSPSTSTKAQASPYSGMRFGYYTNRGHFIRYKDDGSVELSKDKTISDLLAGIHISLDTPFNGFFSYVDQTMRGDLYKHQHQGFTELSSGDNINFFVSIITE